MIHDDNGELPTELDFFKYAKGGSSIKRKAAEIIDEEDQKRRKLSDDEAEEPDAAVDEETPAVPRHRVVAKGSNIPEHADTFAALKDRYKIPPQILANLSKKRIHSPYGNSVVWNSNTAGGG